MPQRLLSLRITATACLLAVGFAFAGCNGGGSSGPSLNVSGTYRINGNSSTVGRFSATATVSQSGGTVTGGYQNNRGQSFALRGPVDGTHASGQLIRTNNAATCTFDDVMTREWAAGRSGADPSRIA